MCAFVDKKKDVEFAPNVGARYPTAGKPLSCLGSDPDLIKLAQAGHNLTLAHFLMAADNAKTIHCNINVAFLNSNLGVFDIRSFTFWWFPANVAARTLENSVDFTRSSIIG